MTDPSSAFQTPSKSKPNSRADSGCDGAEAAEAPGRSGEPSSRGSVTNKCRVFCDHLARALLPSAPTGTSVQTNGDPALPNNWMRLSDISSRLSDSEDKLGTSTSNFQLSPTSCHLPEYAAASPGIGCFAGVLGLLVDPVWSTPFPCDPGIFNTFAIGHNFLIFSNCWACRFIAGACFGSCNVATSCMAHCLRRSGSNCVSAASSERREQSASMTKSSSFATAAI
mmetsp:Transcript_60620/g.198281  ORF Transcript_60620/g.198281 Transcript_60620/m.198281 type:complete len:225 (-) Transcript_60620:261-935(-)